MKRVHDNLWRGPRPTNLEHLQAVCFTRVISLQSGTRDRWSDELIEDQVKHAKEFGIEYINVPCRNYFPPTKEQVLQVDDLLHDTHIKTYLHCQSGVDRTGYMCAIYRMQWQGWSFQRAYDEFVAEGRHSWFFWWKSWLKEWETEV